MDAYLTALFPFTEGEGTEAWNQFEAVFFAPSTATPPIPGLLLAVTSLVDKVGDTASGRTLEAAALQQLLEDMDPQIRTGEIHNLFHDLGLPLEGIIQEDELHWFFKWHSSRFTVPMLQQALAAYSVAQGTPEERTQGSQGQPQVRAQDQPLEAPGAEEVPRQPLAPTPTAAPAPGPFQAFTQVRAPALAQEPRRLIPPAAQGSDTGLAAHDTERAEALRSGMAAKQSQLAPLPVAAPSQDLQQPHPSTHEQPSEVGHSRTTPGQAANNARLPAVEEEASGHEAAWTAGDDEGPLAKGGIGQMHPGERREEPNGARGSVPQPLSANNEEAASALPSVRNEETAQPRAELGTAPCAGDVVPAATAERDNPPQAGPAQQTTPRTASAQEAEEGATPFRNLTPPEAGGDLGAGPTLQADAGSGSGRREDPTACETRPDGHNQPERGSGSDSTLSETPARELLQNPASGGALPDVSAPSSNDDVMAQRGGLEGENAHREAEEQSAQAQERTAQDDHAPADEGEGLRDSGQQGGEQTPLTWSAAAAGGPSASAAGNSHLGTARASQGGDRETGVPTEGLRDPGTGGVVEPTAGTPLTADHDTPWYSGAEAVSALTKLCEHYVWKVLHQAWQETLFSAQSPHTQRQLAKSFIKERQGLIPAVDACQHSADKVKLLLEAISNGSCGTAGVEGNTRYCLVESDWEVMSEILSVDFVLYGVPDTDGACPICGGEGHRHTSSKPARLPVQWRQGEGSALHQWRPLPE